MEIGFVIECLPPMSSPTHPSLLPDDLLQDTDCRMKQGWRTRGDVPGVKYRGILTSQKKPHRESSCGRSPSLLCQPGETLSCHVTCSWQFRRVAKFRPIAIEMQQLKLGWLPFTACRWWRCTSDCLPVEIDVRQLISYKNLCKKKSILVNLHFSTEQFRKFILENISYGIHRLQWTLAANQTVAAMFSL